MGINSGEINYLLKIPDETEATNSGLHWNRFEKLVTDNLKGNWVFFK